MYTVAFFCGISIFKITDYIFCFFFANRILRNAVLAELLLFLMVSYFLKKKKPKTKLTRKLVEQMFKLSMCILCVSSLQVANCAPSGPREDGAVQGLGADPSAARLPRHRHKAVASSTSLSSPSSSSSSSLQSPPSGFQRTYRWSTACSVKQQTAATGGGDLLRFLPGSLVDARGVATDPDSKSFFNFFFFFKEGKSKHTFLFQRVC